MVTPRVVGDETMMKLFVRENPTPVDDLLDSLWIKKSVTKETYVAPEELGLHKHDVPGDGNCFYHAFIRSRWGTNATTTAQKMRAELLDSFYALKQNKTRVALGDDVKKRLQSENAYAQNEEIHMVCALYETRINVWVDDEKVWITFEPREPVKNVVYVQLDGGRYVYDGFETIGNHFQSLVMPFAPFALDIQLFRDTSCRCVCTMDKVRDFDANGLFIEKYGLAESKEADFQERTAEHLSSGRWMRDRDVFESLGVKHKSDISIAVVSGVVIVYRLENVRAFHEAMRAHELWFSSAYELLKLLTTWNKERPPVEELMIMGLFGDFKPCASRFFELDLGSDHEKIKKLRSRDENIFETFRQAYQLYFFYISP